MYKIDVNVKKNIFHVKTDVVFNIKLDLPHNKAKTTQQKGCLDTLTHQ